MYDFFWEGGWGDIFDKKNREVRCLLPLLYINTGHTYVSLDPLNPKFLIKVFEELQNAINKTLN